MRRLAQALILAWAFAMCICLAACGLGLSGDGALGAADATSGSLHDGAGPGRDGRGEDAATGQDGSCPTSITCNGACASSCDACDAGPAVCPATHACGNCSTCAGFSLECFACDGGSGSTAFCSTPGNQCGLPLASHCPCTYGMPGECPGANQICSQQGACLTCGEDGSANITCANGLLCVVGPAGAPACTGS